MRFVQLVKIGNWDTRTVIKQILNVKVGGMLLDEMRKRMKLADLFEEVVRTEVPLSDEQFAFLAAAINSNLYGVAHKDLLAVIDGILAAPEQSAAVKANGHAAEASVDAA